MAPFRPTNLNKRAYPGNANVIGPTRQATCCPTTTTCYQCYSNVFGATSAEIFTLGCRCTTQTCPFCHCCCCCTCTVCTRTIPSGIWSSSEQYEARKRDAWSASSCSNTAPIGYCSACCGTLTSVGSDCGGFYICCGPSTQKWFVAPSCTQVAVNFSSRNNAVTCANSLMGSLGWFIPTISQLQNPGYFCRSYWDTFTSGLYYSNTSYIVHHYGQGSNTWGCIVNFSNGALGACVSGTVNQVRAFRCTA